MIDPKSEIAFIENEEGYKCVMSEIEQLIKAGSSTVRAEDLAYYNLLAKAEQDYEQRTYPL